MDSAIVSTNCHRADNRGSLTKTSALGVPRVTTHSAQNAAAAAAKRVRRSIDDRIYMI